MKNKFLIISFLLIIYGLTLIAIIMPDKKISYTEKRYLKEFPEFKLDSAYSATLESYLLDQFPFRDTFRSIKAYYNYNLLFKEENNDVILYQDGIYKTLYPTNYKSLNNYIDYLSKISANFTSNNHIYLALIPDKNYYITKKNFLQLNYEDIYQEVMSLPFKNIDLRNTLNLESYYLTDTHWRQEKLLDTASVIATSMGNTPITINHTYNKYPSFKGVYYQEAAINSPKDTLIYLTDIYTQNAKVEYLENPKLTKVYNEDKLTSFDPYEVFLDGASAYIEIENPLSQNSKELVIFRDSFGSSIIPLLIPYYQKITVIDNRYIGSKSFLNLITFTNQDILFLNSTLLVNESFTLKK